MIGDSLHETATCAGICVATGCEALQDLEMGNDGMHFALSSLKKVRAAVDFYIDFAREAREAFKLKSDSMSRWTFAAQEASVVQLRFSAFQPLSYHVND